MNTKLTLRLEDILITEAKKYAKNRGKSLSQIVADYFRALRVDPSLEKVKKRKTLGPITSKLYGSLKGSPLSERDYKKHLESKYL